MFSGLGLPVWVDSAALALAWKSATSIQKAVVPVILEGKDVVALAETGAGKTAAFALPILAKMHPDGIHGPLKNRDLQCLILTPTRELSEQIGGVCQDLLRLGSSKRRKIEEANSTQAANAEDDVALLISGDNYVDQVLHLAKGAPIVVGTLGRVAEHLENTAGFTLKHVKWIVIDEADRLLKEDTADALTNVLSKCPFEAQTLLFSATLTDQVKRLRAARLRDPAQVTTSSRYSAVPGLDESVIPVKMKNKWSVLSALLLEDKSLQQIVFCNTGVTAEGLSQVLQKLGFSATVLHGKMPNEARVEALNAMRQNKVKVLVATDVAARGLDVPDVGLVVNFDVPVGAKEYTHRIGRTARAGKTGKAITLVTEYDVEEFNTIEESVRRRIPAAIAPKNAQKLNDRVEAARKEVFIQERKKQGVKKKTITNASLY